MPKAGFKTITVTDLVYDTFEKIYLDNKEEYAMKGISSFSGYITDKIETIMKNFNVTEKYPPRFKVITIEETRIVLKDGKIDRIVEISIKKGMLTCHLCNSEKCPHIGFCYSLHQIYRTISS